MKKILPIVALVGLFIVIILKLQKDLLPEHNEQDSIYTEQDKKSLDKIIESSSQQANPQVTTIGKDQRETQIIIPLDKMQPCDAFKQVNAKLDPLSVLGSYSQALINTLGESKTSEIRNVLGMLLKKKVINDPKTEMELFIAATIEAGLYKAKYKNPTKSKFYFKKLQGMNSENGAYYYFNIANITDKEELRDEINKMLRSKDFDSHMSTLYRSMWEKTIDNFSLFMGTINVFAGTPFPNFSMPMKIINNNLHLLDKNAFKEYAELVMKKNARFKGQFIDVWWTPLEYAVFRNMHKKISPKKAFPKVNELMNQADNLRIRKKVGEIWQKMQKNCNDSQVENYLEEERNYYNEFKRRISPN